MQFKERTINCGSFTASNCYDNEYIDITIGSITMSISMGIHVEEGEATEEECWAIVEQMIGYDRISIGDLDADDYAEDFREFCNDNAYYQDTTYSEHLFMPNGLLDLLGGLDFITPTERKRFTETLTALKEHCEKNNYRLLRFIQN